jgi:hypothetical protein
MLTTIFRAIVDKGAQYSVIFYAPAFPFWLIIHLNIEYWRGNAKKAYLTAFLMWTAISGPLLLYKAAVFSLRWQSPVWMVGLGTNDSNFGFTAGSANFPQYFAANHIGVGGTGAFEKHSTTAPKGNLFANATPNLFSPFHIYSWPGHGYRRRSKLGLACVGLRLNTADYSCRERELIRRYGDGYRAYMRRVPRFFPKWP